MTVYRVRSLALSAALGVSLLALAGAAQAQDRLSVVSSFSILSDILENVGGDKIDVTTLVGAEVDAHVWTPGPAEVEAVKGADLVVLAGLDFEGWDKQLIQDAGYTGPVVTVTEGIAPHMMAKGWGSEVMHSDSPGGPMHSHGSLDPHVWNDLHNGIVFVDNIEAGLKAADPANAATYTANADAYRAQLLALDGEIRARMDEIPYDQRRLLMSHDDMGYFGSAYEVDMVPPVDNDKIIETVKEQWVTGVFMEGLADSDPALAKQITDETGVAVGGPLWTDTLSGPGGPATTYIDMQRHNADMILDALEATMLTTASK